MKMKQLLTLTLAATMVAGTSLTAAASSTGTGFNPPVQEDEKIVFDSDTQSSEDTEIPVYGYVGPDAVLLDEDPDDPDTAPTPKDPNEVDYEINVSVPVKILWAAFEGDKDSSGIAEVASPDYYIRNNSEELSVSVTADSFSATGTDNTYVDSYWEEALTLTSQNSIMKSDVKLGDAAVNLGSLAATDQMEFNITGELNVDDVESAYSTANSGGDIMNSDYSEVLQPEYELILTISAMTL